MDLPSSKGMHGYIGRRDFSGQIISEHEKEGWVFHCRVTIWKDPVVEMQRTKAVGLLHKTIKKDSCKSRMGNPDYLLVFYKPGENAEPVTHTAESFPVDQWQEWASPVWMSIRQTNVLNKKGAKDERDEKHICVQKGTLILTENGLEKIEKVEVGKKVLTHKGRWRKVLAKAKTADSADVVRIKAQGVADLRVTPTHKIWAKNIPPVARRKDKAKTVNPDWTYAKDAGNSYVNIPKIDPEISEYPELEWWIVGRWIADGHREKRGGLIISVGLEKFDAFMEKVGDYAGATSQRTAYQVRIKDRDGRLRSIIDQCGKGADNKRLPGAAFTLPSSLAKSLLDGYLSGDGHYNEIRDRWSCTTVSRELAIGLQFLVFNAYDSVATLAKGRPPGSSVIEGRTVQTKQEWIVTFNISGYSFGFTSDDGSWKPVKSIEPDGKAETWTLQVEEDASYVADGIAVKNCPLQLDVIQRALVLWSNPGDVVLSPFTGIGSEGYTSIKHGRKFVGTELKESYFTQAVANLRKAESEGGTLL